jgi:hypothetical protein
MEPLALFVHDRLQISVVLYHADRYRGVWDSHALAKFIAPTGNYFLRLQNIHAKRIKIVKKTRSYI